jgi:hypothetical protein
VIRFDSMVQEEGFYSTFVRGESRVQLVWAFIAKPSTVVGNWIVILESEGRSVPSTKKTVTGLDSSIVELPVGLILKLDRLPVVSELSRTIKFDVS